MDQSNREHNIIGSEPIQTREAADPANVTAFIDRHPELIGTIAPKFTGRFNKGVDYVGDPVQFEKDFNGDLAVITLRACFEETLTLFGTDWPVCLLRISSYKSWAETVRSFAVRIYDL